MRVRARYRLSNLFLYLVCVTFWGPTWLAITYQLGTVAAEASVAYRFMLAAALLLAYCLIRRLPMRYSGRDHGIIALQGLFLFALSYVMIYYAEQRLASGLVAVLFTSIIFLNIVGARLAFR